MAFAHERSILTQLPRTVRDAVYTMGVCAVNEVASVVSNAKTGVWLQIVTEIDCAVCI